MDPGLRRDLDLLMIDLTNFAIGTLVVLAEQTAAGDFVIRRHHPSAIWSNGERGLPPPGRCDRIGLIRTAGGADGLLRNRRLQAADGNSPRGRSGESGGAA